MTEMEMEILQGIVGAVVYQNYDNGYAVLRLNCESGQTVTVVGTIPLPSVGERPARNLSRQALAEVVEQMDISIAVISSPTSVAPSLVVPIINAGIKGVINFTSAPLNFPQGIVAENYDITTVLEKVAYFVKEADENGDKS